MKKSIPVVTLLAMSTLLLTGCNQKVSKEQFASVLNDGKANVNEVTNVNFHNKLSVENFNYKEGEFYTHKNGLILSHQAEYTWKDEDGKYYHYVNIVITGTKTKTELTESQFNNNMTAHKAKIVGELLNPLLKAEQLMDENQEAYKTVKNSFTKNSMKKQYTLSSTCTIEYRTNEVYEYNEETGEQTLVSYDTETKT